MNDPTVPYAPGWLSPVDIARTVTDGFLPLTDWRCVTVTALWLAESGGNPRAVGTPAQITVRGVHRWGVALGLCQLFSAVHVDEAAFPDWPRLTVYQCFNPFANWRRAWDIMNQQRPDRFLYNLDPWEAYTRVDPRTGAKVYKAHVPMALAAVRYIGGTI